MEEQGDPFHFLFNFCEIPSSQKQLLQIIPFFGEPSVNVADGGGSKKKQHDVYHAPPENSLGASSSHQPRVVDFVDLDDSDDEETEIVNLNSGPALGFSKGESSGIKRNAGESQVEKRKCLEPPSRGEENVKKKKSSLVFDVLRILAEIERAQKSASKDLFRKE